MHIYYNPNPDGKTVGDCVIRGISGITGTDWEDTYLGVAMTGLRMHDMPQSNAVWGSYLRNLGFRRYVLPNSCPDCYTVKNFCYDHPNGVYLLATGEHVVAVKNGDYYDSWDSGSEIPVYYWQKGV